MGQQNSKGEIIFNERSNSLIWNNKLNCKTNFHYIHPIKCEGDQHIVAQETLPEEEQVNKNKDEEQYWQIQKNQAEPTLNSLKDLEKIQEIKVKWDQFIKMKKRNYLEDYSVLKQIGRGGFGCVHKVKARYTGIYRAAKRIKKAQLKKSEHQKLFQEMAIMMSLDHPNIAKLYEVYDYKSYYVLILELCQGGQLFKKIVTKQLNQQTSAKVMKQILWTLIYLHKKGIVHRDLKPQNMLFQCDSDVLKIIDFGIAVKKKPDQVLTSRLGTPYYIAPEVLCKNYGQKCDIWSAGVILFMMISGYPPFRGQNQHEVMENVLKEQVIFKGSIWTRVTSQCKQLISLMLKKNPQQRLSAAQAFEHPWIKKVKEKFKTSTQLNVLSNLRGFSFQNRLQAVVYTYIVSQLLTSEQKKVIFQTFKSLDKNNDGVIEVSQLKEALKLKKDISQERVKFLMRIIDTNGSGQIDYTQFLVAGIDPKKCLTEYHFQQAFQYFDMDHSGAITFQEIAFFLQDKKESEDYIKKIFRQIDQNNDGNISKEEFVKLLMSETKKKMKSFTQLDCSENNSHKSKKQETTRKSNLQNKSLSATKTGKDQLTIDSNGKKVSKIQQKKDLKQMNIQTKQPIKENLQVSKTAKKNENEKTKDAKISPENNTLLAKRDSRKSQQSTREKSNEKNKIKQKNKNEQIAESQNKQTMISKQQATKQKTPLKKVPQREQKQKPKGQKSSLLKSKQNNVINPKQFKNHKKVVIVD